MTFLPLLWSETGDSRRRRAGAKAFGDLDLAIRHIPASPEHAVTVQTVSRKRLTRWNTLICRPRSCRNPQRPGVRSTARCWFCASRVLDAEAATSFLYHVIGHSASRSQQTGGGVFGGA